MLRALRAPILTRPSARWASSRRYVEPSIWTSLVPKSFRDRSSTKKPATRKDWNPATLYIIMLMLIGSQAIQQIALRTHYSTFVQSSDARIRLLKEIVERLQKGEDVDVAGLLGTGDPKQEEGWQDFIDELANEDLMKQANERPKFNNPARKAKTQKPTDGKVNYY